MFFMKKILLFLLCCYSLQAQLTSGLQNYTLASGRGYAVTTPNNYNPNKDYPIVFELHALGSNRTQMHDQNLVDHEQYISVRPEGTYVNLLFGTYKGHVWNTWPGKTDWATGYANDVVYITNVYADLKQKMGNAFNPNRVLVYGSSNGGAMAMKMLEETPLFKAAIIRSMSFEKDHNIPITTSKVPIIFVHGTDDDLVPYQGGAAPAYSWIAPSFESIKTTVAKWAAHYQLAGKFQEVKYLKDVSTISKHDFYFREYAHDKYPIYFFVIQDGVHTTTDQFDNSNIKRAVLKLAKNPQCYGLARDLNYCL